MLSTVLVRSAFCMYGSELLGGLQPPEPPPPPPPPPLDPPLQWYT